MAARAAVLYRNGHHFRDRGLHRVLRQLLFEVAVWLARSFITRPCSRDAVHGVDHPSHRTNLVDLDSRTDIHRRLGAAGAVLAGTMTIAGLATAVAALRLNRMPIDYFAVPMGSVVVFPTLVAAAFVTATSA
jgi:hypothetical protein